MLEIPALLRRAALTEDDLLRYVNYPRAQAVAARDKAVAVALWSVCDWLADELGEDNAATLLMNSLLSAGIDKPNLR